MSKLNDQQKAAIDRLFINNFNRKEAYTFVYPEVKAKFAGQYMYQLLQNPEVQEYYASKYEEFKSVLNIDKHMMLDNLTNQISQFDDMVALAAKDDLTEDEEYRLKRLGWIIKGSDVMKAKDMICRIIGAYEPEKIEVSNKTWNVGFDSDDIEEAKEV